MGERGGNLRICRDDHESPVAQDLIARLNAELNERYPEDDTANHFRLDSHEVAPGLGSFLVAYEEAVPIGCGAVRRIEAGGAEVERVHVAPAVRGRGVGR